MTRRSESECQLNCDRFQRQDALLICHNDVSDPQCSRLQTLGCWRCCRMYHWPVQVSRCCRMWYHQRCRHSWGTPLYWKSGWLTQCCTSLNIGALVMIHIIASILPTFSTRLFLLSTDYCCGLVKVFVSVFWFVPVLVFWHTLSVKWCWQMYYFGHSKLHALLYQKSVVWFVGICTMTTFWFRQCSKNHRSRKGIESLLV